MISNYKLNMILSIIFISLIYSLSISVQPAKADCVDVTQDPCLCEIFDVPYDSSTMHFLWRMYRRDEDELNYLRTLNIQIDSCNLDYKDFCGNSLTLEDCLYFKHALYSNRLDFGFNKVVNVGDTISIYDFDTRNTQLLEMFQKLDSAICKFDIIVEYFDANNNNYFVGTILFESYFEGIKIREFKSSMYDNGYGNIVSGLYWVQVFDYTMDVVDEEKQDLGFIINQSNSDEFLIHYNQNGNNEQVEIYNILGICQIRSEMNSSTTVLDISRLPAGVYFIRIGDKVEKFVKM